MTIPRTLLLASLLTAGCTTPKAPPTPATSQPTTPVAPLEIHSAGILFDGGTSSVQFTDATGTPWSVGLLQVGLPNDETGRRTLRVSRDGSPKLELELDCRSPAARRIEHQLTQALVREHGHARTTRLATAPDAPTTTDAERDASIVIGIVAGIRAERLIEQNERLSRQRTEIAAALIPVLIQIGELEADPAKKFEDWTRLEESRREMILLDARWDQLYHTVTAIARQDPWLP